MKDTFWFKHDNTSFMDARCISLRQKMGLEGYGIFWAILEHLHREGGEAILDLDILSDTCRTDPDKIKRVVEGFGLFVIDGQTFYSPRMLRDMDKREADKKNGQKGGTGKKGLNPPLQPPPSTPPLNPPVVGGGQAREEKRREEIEKDREEKERENIKKEAIHAPEPKPLAEMTASEVNLSTVDLMKKAKALHDRLDGKPEAKPEPPVNLYQLKIRQWKEMYQAQEHPEKLERPYYHAIERIKTEFPDTDPHEKMFQLTKKYLDFCQATTRFKVAGAKFLTDSVFMDDWTIQPTQKTQGTPAITTEPKRKRIQIMGDTERIIGG